MRERHACHFILSSRQHDDQKLSFYDVIPSLARAQSTQHIKLKKMINVLLLLLLEVSFSKKKKMFFPSFWYHSLRANCCIRTKSVVVQTHNYERKNHKCAASHSWIIRATCSHRISAKSYWWWAMSWWISYYMKLVRLLSDIGVNHALQNRTRVAQLIRFDDKSDEEGNGLVMRALNGFRCLAFDHESSWIEDMLNGMDEGIDEFFTVRRS